MKARNSSPKQEALLSTTSCIYQFIMFDTFIYFATENSSLYFDIFSFSSDNYQALHYSICNIMTFYVLSLFISSKNLFFALYFEKDKFVS